ncbi:Putative FBD-associated F-box protein At5g56690 [Linum perenne]
MAEDDLFDKLPEELLTKITAFLPLEESARTSSLLSKRWRYAWRGTPNPNFDGNAATKFRSDGYPISCFETVDDFFNWMEKMINQSIDFYIESLGLNFNPGEDDQFGWIELRNSDSVKIGYRVVSFLSPPQPPEAAAAEAVSSLSDVLSGRPYLLKNLTLRNCDVEILRRKVVAAADGGNGGSFRGLRTLVLQCGGKSMDGETIGSFIGSFPSVMSITLEDCGSLVVDDGSSPVIVVGESWIKLYLCRRRIFRISCEE